VTKSPALRLVGPTDGPASDDQDPIAAIQARLRRFPQARVEATETRVTVFPLDSTGFTVGFQIHGDRYLVTCDGWHEEFEAQGPALDCFGMALSPAARLRVTQRGTFAYKWQCQILRDGAWCGTTETGLLFFPFWRRRTVVYLQNRLLTAA
jgi:hypothetical protein